MAARTQTFSAAPVGVAANVKATSPAPMSAVSEMEVKGAGAAMRGGVLAIGEPRSKRRVARPTKAVWAVRTWGWPRELVDGLVRAQEFQASLLAAVRDCHA